MWASPPRTVRNRAARGGRSAFGPPFRRAWLACDRCPTFEEFRISKAATGSTTAAVIPPSVDVSLSPPGDQDLVRRPRGRQCRRAKMCPAAVGDGPGHAVSPRRSTMPIGATQPRKRPFPNDDAALDAACKLIVQAWRSKAPQLEHLAATVIHEIEQRARASEVSSSSPGRPVQ